MAELGDLALVMSAQWLVILVKPGEGSYCLGMSSSLFSLPSYGWLSYWGSHLGARCSTAA